MLRLSTKLFPTTRMSSSMSPKSISNMNLSSRCMSTPTQNANTLNSLNNSTRKNFTSYSKPALSYYDMYNTQPEYLENEDSGVASLSHKSHPTVINNGFADVAHDELTHIDSAESDVYSIPDEHFVPQVSTDGEAHHHGHSKV
ncbi:unnamed protein product [Ambrosiozyma monospora]|uniref:Unnamed protein product n=1 Tax=Ambrosiozyma monospora TaxID=43982 RepID=A0ACB5SW41_AMBMO|nr:unnamed protein product [Ambrosiozyma monospora]